MSEFVLVNPRALYRQADSILSEKETDDFAAWATCVNGEILVWPMHREFMAAGSSPVVWSCTGPRA